MSRVRAAKRAIARAAPRPAADLRYAAVPKAKPAKPAKPDKPQALRIASTKPRPAGTAKPASGLKTRPAAKVVAVPRLRATRPRQPGQPHAAARRRSWLWFALKATAAVSGVLALLLAGAIAYTLAIMPPLERTAAKSAKEGSGLTILAADGSAVSRTAHAERYVPLERLPTHLVDAILATEDRRFYQHWGLDPWGLMRASAVNAWNGRTIQGGSTITQQLAKNLFLEPKRTMARKLEEALYALALEARFSKDEILELYVNRVYLGGGAYGIAAASDLYFGVPPEQLTLAQSAIVAGLLKAPSRYAPTNSVAMAKARAKTVLSAMADAQIISPELAEAAKREPVALLQEGSAETGSASAGYVTDWVSDLLPTLVPTATGSGGGKDLSVATTIDLSLQHQAEIIVRRVLDGEGKKLGASEAAVVVLDNDGAIRALVGGRSYTTSPFNRAVKAKRQPGSAFKPFVFLAAVEAGMTADTVLIDAPFTVGDWTPRNYTGEYKGPVTARDALAQSMNTVAVRMFQTAGRDGVVATARRLGITSPLTDDASLALGTSEVTPLELAGAYVPFANGGRLVTPHLISSISDAKGKPRWRYRPPAPRTVIAPEALAAITDMMTETLETGTGQGAALAGIPAAGKTGTTQDSRDAWFAGVTAHYTAVVWVGNDNGKPMQKVTGGTLPAKIWRDVMRAAHAGVDAEELPGTRVSAAGLTLTGLFQSIGH